MLTACSDYVKVNLSNKMRRERDRMMKKKWVVPTITGVTFLVLILLLKFVDVAAVGPCGTEIGLSHINKAVHDFIGEHMLWYDITDVLGMLSLAVAAAFGALGVFQFIKRRNLKKVDKKIIALGGLYVVMLGCYVLFEKVIINYRPILMPESDTPEAAFPSSHTMLVCVIMGSTAMVIGDYVKNDKIKRLLKILCLVMIGIIVVGRLLAGVHWLTDILGGVLLSATLLGMYACVTEKL